MWFFPDKNFLLISKHTPLQGLNFIKKVYIILSYIYFFNEIKFNEAQAKKFEELGDKEKAAYWRGKASAEKEILRCCY